MSLRARIVQRVSRLWPRIVQRVSRLWPRRWTLDAQNERLDTPRGAPDYQSRNSSFGSFMRRRQGPGPLGPSRWNAQAYNERIESGERDDE